MDEREQREMVRFLVMGSIQMVQAFEEIWASYQELSKAAVSLDDDVLYDQVVRATAELEQNLVEVLEHVRGQLHLLSGVDEPLPHEPVEDFESSVLTTIADLDNIDLEVYRDKNKDKNKDKNNEDG